MFVSFITSWYGADKYLCLVISPHMSPEVLFGWEGSPALLTSKLLLVPVFFLPEFFLPVRHFCLFIHLILNYPGQGGEIHSRIIPEGCGPDY